MSLHKLTAGDGDTYLTRQVAGHDVTSSGRSGLADHYSDRGEQPGRWWGRGLKGLGHGFAGVPVVEDGGSMITFASATGQAPALPLGDLIYRGITLRAFYILNWLRDTSHERLERIYAELVDLAGQGVISAAVEATYPLAEYPAAVRHAQRSGRSGKILFTANA
jgi:hypothetical protein